jgi:hypothetical protein
MVLLVPTRKKKDKKMDFAKYTRGARLIDVSRLSREEFRSLNNLLEELGAWLREDGSVCYSSEDRISYGRVRSVHPDRLWDEEARLWLIFHAAQHRAVGSGGRV